MSEEFARVLVPRYIPSVHFDNRHGEYAPWVITAPNQKMLTNEALDRKYEEWREVSEPEDEDDFSNFIQWLDEVDDSGYDVKNVETPGVWQPRYVKVQPDSAVLKPKTS